VDIPEYYHTPVRSSSRRVLCPVCKKPVYSLSGIHPQCAMSHPEPPEEGRRGLEPTAEIPSMERDDRNPADLAGEGCVEGPPEG